MNDQLGTLVPLLGWGRQQAVGDLTAISKVFYSLAYLKYHPIAGLAPE